MFEDYDKCRNGTVTYSQVFYNFIIKWILSAYENFSRLLRMYKMSLFSSQNV